MNQPLRYHIQFFDRLFEVREIRGTEALSTPFRFEASFAIDDGLPIDPDDLVRGEVAILMMREGECIRRIDGLMTDVLISGSIRGAPDLTLIIEPRLSLAGYRTDIRVFCDKSVPDIVLDVLSQVGVVPELRLRETYPPRPYCVQFQETDLDFVHRLLEDEGIFYFFLEGDKLVMGDSPAAYQPIQGNAAVPFRAGFGLDSGEEAIFSWEKSATLSVGKVSLRDFNPEHPSLDMDVVVAGPSPAGPEYYDYPGEYLEPDDGTRKARLMSQAFACSAEAISAKSFCPRLVPGCTFNLLALSQGAAAGEYVISSVDHRFSRADDGFQNTVAVLEADVTYRPPRNTYVPCILNPMTGVVTGPPGQDDIYTDAFGRVKVHFPWDRRMPVDDTCSYWIPVLQDNTGESSAIPRMGWEVLVHFLEGDPDRPVVLGRVYNGEDQFPSKLPLFKSRSALKSLSTPTRDGSNEIYFEDLSGEEYIYIQAERDQNVNVANNRDETILVSETSTIQRDETIEIGNDHTVTVHQSMKPTVSQNQTWTTGGDRFIGVAEADTESVQLDRSFTVGGMHDIRVAHHDMTSAKVLIEQVGGSVFESFGRTNATESGLDTVSSVSGSVFETAGQSIAENVAESQVQSIGGNVFSKADIESKMTAGKRRISSIAGSLTVNAQKQITLTGANRFKSISPTATHTASEKVTLKVKDTSVVFKDGLVHICTQGPITVTVSGENQEGSTESYQI